jgi:tetratricopeptide (TPR) repeat protein
LAEALAAAEEALEAMRLMSTRHECIKRGFVEALEAAFALGELAKVDQLLARIDALRPGELPPFLDGQRSRFRAKLAVAAGARDNVEPRFKAAVGILREYGVRFWLAVTLLEHGEWLVSQGRREEAEQLLSEACEIFESLEAAPWLDRAARVRVRTQAEVAS